MSSDQQELKLSDITDSMISEFDKAYLPSNLKVLPRLMFETQGKKFIKLVDVVDIVIKEVISVWEESTIKTQRIDSCKRKLQRLYESFDQARKSKSKKQAKKVTNFLKEMTDVFDISSYFVIKLLSSMDVTVKKVFLLKPVDYLKGKISLIESGTLADRDILSLEDIAMMNQSSP